MDIVIAILSLLCLASAFITFGLGIGAYIKNPQSVLNRLFLVMMLSATYWAVGEFMIWQVGTLDGAWFWLKASSFWPFALAFTLNFALMFTRPELNNRYRGLFLACIYIPTALIAGFLLFTNWIYTVGNLPGSGYAYLPVQDSLAYPVYAAYIFMMMLVAIGVFYTYWRHATTPKIKNQALLFCAGLSAIIFFGSLSGFILPALSIWTPNLVFIGIVIFSYIVTISMRKHELFILSPTTAVPDILRAMPDAMVLADINGRIISTNESCGMVFGLDWKTLPGKQVTAIIPEEAFVRIQSAVLEQGTITNLETNPNEITTRTVSIAGSRVSDPSGDPAGMVLIIRDITDRIAAETALLIAGKKISLLTQLTRHDVNNLVSALSGYLLLLQENPDDPGRESYISASMQIAEKIYNQLQFTREYQDIGSRQPTWLVLEETFSRAMSDLSEKNITITQKIAKVEIFTDPSFVKVIYNLLENATRHGGHITRINISASQQDDTTLKIIVEDDGVGIRTEDKDCIFQYGFGKNTGLGLAVSRDILSLTGITITETGTMGSGARFELTVPSTAWRRHPQ